MMKRSLAWALSLALILSALSGMAAIAAADGPGFALVSFESGERLYKNAAESSFSSGIVLTETAPVTGQASDRFAAYMGYQNNNVQMRIPASAGLGNRVTAEIRFRGHDDNREGTRLGISYTSSSGETGFDRIVLSGPRGTEVLTMDAAEVEATYSFIDEAGGWRVLKLEIENADYFIGGHFSLVKWGNGNSAGDGIDGWYIRSLLLYDTDRGRPTEEEMYLRESTVGIIDFTGDGVEQELLTYAADGNCSLVDYDGMRALKIAGGDGFHLTVTADDVSQPAVFAADKAVSFLIELSYKTDNWNNRFYLQDTADSSAICGWGHEWNAQNGRKGYPENSDEWTVLRWDLTDNAGTEFRFGSWISGDTAVYIRRILVCRTELVSESAFDNAAFVNFDEPYAPYPDFLDVLSDSYKLTWNVAEMGAGDRYALDEVQGKTALSAPGGYLYLKVEDAFTRHPRLGTDVADLNFTLTYLDGEGTIGIHYNAQTPADFESLPFEQQIPYLYKGVQLPMTGTGQWQTATVYVSDAGFRNGQNGGADMRIILNGDTVISSVQVAIGADKRELLRLLNQFHVYNAAYSPESVADFNRARAFAQRVADDLYATKAQVEEAIAQLQEAIDGLVRITDPRFEILGAAWDKDASNGEIVVKDGWYAFKFERGHWKRFGVGDPGGILADSTSVTYEYEVLFDTATESDRCFLDFGDAMKWHQVEEGAAYYDSEGYLLSGNGFNAGANWNPIPRLGEWGTIRLRNDHFDPTQLSHGCVTELHSFFQEGDLYIRSVTVYDNEDPTKFIRLRFNENVNELILSGGDAEVDRVTKEGETAWVIPSGWKALHIDVNRLLADGTLTAGTKRFAVKISYWLEETDNENELLMVKHYNPSGTGDNENKRSECEHQLTHAQLERRGSWAQHTFLLDDGLFTASDKKLNLTYGNGTAVYIRGVEVYEVDEAGEKTDKTPARWGLILSDIAAQFTHPTYDFEQDIGYLMQIRFDEGAIPHVIREDNGRRCLILADEFMYVNVDDSYLTPADRYVRIDFTHENGARLYLQYNVFTPADVNDSVEPYLTEYRFHDSRSPRSVGEELEITNPLGAVLPVSDEHNNWTVTSIYLSDAQFRNAANGSDFRVRTLGPSAISRIEAIKITEEEYAAAKAALGDKTELKALLDRVAELYPDENTIPDLLWDVYDPARKFAAEFGYRADQTAVGEMTQALRDAILKPFIPPYGDADGDGKVTSTDARLALQIAVNKISESDITGDPFFLDVDGNGSITSTDARLILQKAVGKIDGFPLQ